MDNSSVFDAICRIAPNGTAVPNSKLVNTLPNWDEPPLLPVDLFAIASYLLQNSGGYHRLIAQNTRADPLESSIEINQNELKNITKASKAWIVSPVVPDLIEQAWRQLVVKYRDAPLCSPSTTQRTPAPWWKLAYRLLAIADDACLGVGYRSVMIPGQPPNWVVQTVAEMVNKYLPTRPKNGHTTISNPPFTIASPLIDSDIMCIQPKARTPDVGCSPRNLSQNLATLPPKGVMRVNWLMPAVPQIIDGVNPINILAIPFPYKIEDKEFSSQLNSDGQWGWFKIEQGWLTKDLSQIVAFTELMIATAKKSDVVNGIVFPELALDYDSYSAIAEHVRVNHSAIQFLVAGTSTNCAGERGNFAMCTHFSGTHSDRNMVTASRSKHHRWSIDIEQAVSYGLDRRFDWPTKNQSTRYWEKIVLRSREVNILPMTSASVFSVMVCEDLARSDPVHEALRNIGPNLVFVLLMDGPQSEWRWAARYSTGLADDPGSSVLTLTSKALVERWNKDKKTAEQDWSVGVWKDEGGRARPIKCSDGVDASIIRVTGLRQTEYTLDGRSTNSSFAWRMVGTDPVPVTLDRKNNISLLKAMRIID